MATERDKDLLVLTISKLDAVNEKLIKLQFGVDIIIKHIESDEPSEGKSELTSNPIVKKILEDPNTLNKLMELMGNK